MTTSLIIALLLCAPQKLLLVASQCILREASIRGARVHVCDLDTVRILDDLINFILEFKLCVIFLMHDNSSTLFLFSKFVEENGAANSPCGIR